MPFKTMFKFWDEAGTVSRTALVCAGISILINISTYFGVGAHGPMAVAFIMHLVTMAIGFISFFRTWAHHSLYVTRAIEPDTLLITDKKQLPGIMTVRPLFFPVLLALAYLLINFSALGSYGEGYPELTGDQYFWVRRGIAERSMLLSEVTKHEALELRMFSSAWIFFLITTAGWDEMFRKRIVALNDLPLKEAA